jgi:thymidylate synthase
VKQYLDVLRNVLENGQQKGDPQGVGNIALPGQVMTFDLDDGFPLITTKDMSRSWKAVIGELLWFLSGSTKVEDLQARGVQIWNRWATHKICQQMGLPDGELGPIYGRQWRAFNGGTDLSVDQITALIGRLRENPDSRRHIVTAWNPVDADKVFVAPCHCFWQIFHAQGELTLELFQRSADLPIGVPFNIASYTLLLMMIAQVVRMKAKRLVHILGDAHVYMDQIKLAREQIEREPKSLPSVTLYSGTGDIFDFNAGDFQLSGYDNPHPAIKYPVGL